MTDFHFDVFEAHVVAVEMVNPLNVIVIIILKKIKIACRALTQKRMRSSDVTKATHFAELWYKDKSISSNFSFFCLLDFELNDFITYFSIFTSSPDPKVLESTKKSENLWSHGNVTTRHFHHESPLAALLISALM